MDSKPVKPSQTDQREERRKAALRANLQKRKAQARARGTRTDDPVQDEKKES